MLWIEGVNVYDSFKLENFKLKAIVLGTINDFPTYGNLPGHSVKGLYACPVCSKGYRDSRKMSYIFHRKWFGIIHIEHNASDMCFIHIFSYQFLLHLN